MTISIFYFSAGILLTEEFDSLNEAIAFFDYDLERAYDEGLIESNPKEITSEYELQEAVTEYYSCK